MANINNRTKKQRLKDIVRFVKNPIKRRITSQRIRENAYYINQYRKRNIQENTFLFESYHAVSMTGNVYALFIGIAKAKPNASFYWVTKDMQDPMITKMKSEFRELKLKFVLYESHAYYQLLASCEYLFNDTSFMPYFIKKDGQHFINTWHGTPLKTLGTAINNRGLAQHRNIARNLLQADQLIMPNEFTADHLILDHDLAGFFPARVTVTGNPRVDLTLNSNAEEIKSKYALPTDRPILLYAPTWHKLASETTEEDLQQVVQDYNKIQSFVGKRYHVLLKAHYFIYDYFIKNGLADKVVPNWVDTNELLAAVTALITDYSSIFFDFLPLKRPVYFFMPDKNRYTLTRGLYFDPKTLPGDIAESLPELEQLLQLSEAAYLKRHHEKRVAFMNKYCGYDDGHALDRAVTAVLTPEKLPVAKARLLDSEQKERDQDVTCLIKNSGYLISDEAQQELERADLTLLPKASGPVKDFVDEAMVTPTGVHTAVYDYDNHKPSVILYGGGFYNNGITSSLLNLSHDFNYEKFNLIIIELPSNKSERRLNMAKLDSRVHVIFDFSYINMSLHDNYTLDMFYRQGWNSKHLSQTRLTKIFHEDLRRLIGNLVPEYAIDFGGYNKHMTALMSLSAVDHKAIFLHTTVMSEFNKIVNNRYKHRWNLKIIFSLYDHFDKIISVSPSANEQNKQDLKCYVRDPERKMRVVNNLLDTSGLLSSLDEHAELAKLSITNTIDHKDRRVYNQKITKFGVLETQAIIFPDPKVYNFVNVARLSPEKNQIRTIRAFAQVAQATPNVHLYILGFGPLYQQLLDEVLTLGLQDKVTLYGFLPEPEYFIAQCDCYIQTSNYEGQGLSVLEASLVNIPIIVTNVTGLSSVAKLIDNVVVVESDDDEVANAMKRAVKGELKPTSLDAKKYNQDALSQFNQEVLGNK